MKKIALAVAAAAAFAGTAFATDPLVKELFPWFEVGDTVDEATEKAKGMVLDWQADEQSELGACAQYIIKDPNLPETQVLSVVLSVPDRRVLSMRIDAKCESNEEAEDLIEELIAMFKPLECTADQGTKLLEFNWVNDETIFLSLSELNFGFLLHDLLEEAEEAQEEAAE